MDEGPRTQTSRWEASDKWEERLYRDSRPHDERSVVDEGGGEVDGGARYWW